MSAWLQEVETPNPCVLSELVARSRSVRELGGGCKHGRAPPPPDSFFLVGEIKMGFIIPRMGPRMRHILGNPEWHLSKTQNPTHSQNDNPESGLILGFSGSFWDTSFAVYSLGRGGFP